MTINVPVSPIDARIPSTAEGFREHGFACFDNLLDDDEWQTLNRIYDELFSAPEQHPGFIQLGGTDDAGRQLMPQIGAPHRTHPELLTLRYVQRLADLARELLGPTVEHIGSHMILKPAGSPRDTPWHQDQAYHAPTKRYRNVNFRLPLDGASVEDGCMWFVPRSHGGMVVPHVNVGGDATAVAAENQAYWQANGVPVPLNRGSVCAHHSYCLHYAGPNRSPRPRRAWIMVYGTRPEPLPQPLHLPWLADRDPIIAAHTNQGRTTTPR